MAELMKNRPNVLLVIPRYFSTKTYGYIMPVGIMYVSSALKASGICNVYTLNLNHQDEDDETVLRRIINECNIQIVGSTGISGQFIEVQPLLKLVKKINPGIITIVGGGMITADPENTMTAFGDVLDFGVIGEGEITDAELIDAVANNGNFEKVQGIIYWQNGVLVKTPRRSDITDLDSVLMPDYESFDYDKYLVLNGEYENGVKLSPVAIMGGRSCKYNCTFCFHPSGSKYRQRSLDSIFKEIDYLINRFPVNYIALREELFASDLRRVLDWCSRIKDYPISWSIQLRVDTVCPEMVVALKESGCRYIFLGIESADNEILKNMRKNITIEQVEYALNLCADAGLDTRSTLILGDDMKSAESARKTIDWWLKHKAKWTVDLGMIIAFPGSTLYKRARLNGRIPDPIRFLYDGCPIINLSSRMSDTEYSNLAAEVSRLTGIDFVPVNYAE